MIPEVDLYLLEGCGRCPLGGTPQCKVHTWAAELKRLREIVLDTGLEETVKWGVPCYTDGKNNIVMIGAFVDRATLSFFKGVLLKDERGILEKPGPNSQSSRILNFTNVEEINAVEDYIRAYIHEAVENEAQGKKVEFKKNPEPIPDELQDKFDNDPAFQAAFEALTPGRQRGYILYFSQAKQSATRISRIEKYTEKIMQGIGFHDR